MSNPTLRTDLTLNIENFRAGLANSQQSLKTLEGNAKRTAAGIALLERQIVELGRAGASTTAQVARLDEMKKGYRDLQVEIKNTTRQMRDLEAASGENSGAGGRPEEGGAHGEGGGHGNQTGRSAGMEAGHSVRSIFDMMGAGQNLAGALQVELPKLLQASGAGLGKMIGIEAVMSVVKGVQEAWHRATVERIQTQEVLEGDGLGGTRNSSASSMTSRMSALAAKQAELLGNSGPNETGENDNVFGFLMRKMKNASRAVTGRESVEEEKDNQMETLENQRLAFGSEMVRRKTEQAELDERAFHSSQAEVAIERERLALKEKIADVASDKSMDGTAQARMIDLLKKESALRERQLQIEKEKADIQRDMARKESTIAHPQIDGADGKDHLMDLPAGFEKDRAIAEKLARRDGAVSTEESIKKSGGDPREAHNAVLAADSALRDAAIDRELMTPAERYAHDQKQRDRDRAMARIQNRTDRHNQDAASNDTEGQFDAFFHDHSIAQQVRQGSQNAGQGDHAGDSQMDKANTHLESIDNKLDSAFQNRS